jgi:hypothetical protein
LHPIIGISQANAWVTNAHVFITWECILCKHSFCTNKFTKFIKKFIDVLLILLSI